MVATTRLQVTILFFIYIIESVLDQIFVSIGHVLGSQALGQVGVAGSYGFHDGPVLLDGDRRSGLGAQSLAADPEQIFVIIQELVL